ncbi:hypothetical protein D3C80_2117670 [compost metagenome]
MVPPGPPPVSDRITSNTLMELVSAIKTEMVIDGASSGSVMLKNLLSAPAPSTVAASLRSSGTDCRPAI